MIMEYLPSPHAWKWSLNHLKKRATFSPQIAVHDISLLIDELFSELKILNFPHQKGCLMRIATSPEVCDPRDFILLSLSQIRQSLVSDLHLPETLVESLVRWSDVQNLVFRTTELDVSFKSSLAKRYLVVAITLYRMVRLVHDPARLFTLPKMLMQPPSCLMLSKKEQRQDILQINQSLGANSNQSPSVISSAVPPNHLMNELLLQQDTLCQMLYHDGTMQQSHVDTLDDEDSLNEFSCLTNDHDTETELPADGGQFAGSDDEEDDN
jgi:hypothetical protein